MSDEVLIQTIRVAMQDEVACLHPAPELLAAVPAPGRARRRPSLGWLGPALAVGVAVAVAVVALTSLAHRSSGPNGTSASVPVAARRLVSRLAVLRRAQTRADLVPRSQVPELRSLTVPAKLLPRLSRRVGEVHLGQFGSARVYLVVQTPDRFPVHRKRVGPPLLNPRLGDQASIAFIGPFREEAAINGTTVAAYGDPVAATRSGLTGGPEGVDYLWGSVASIVPDGVRHVKWVFRDRRGGVTVWPKVRENVALGKVPLRLEGHLVAAAWYGAHGRLISSVGFSSRPAVKANSFKRALEASVHQPIAPALLRHFSVLRSSHGSGYPGLDRAEAASLIEPNPLQLNTAKERFVADPSGPAKVFVIPGRQGIALSLVSPIVGQAEGGISDALSGSLFAQVGGISGHRTVVGLAPDGNRTVRVLLRNGRSRTVPVVDNVYEFTVPTSARRLLVKNASGRTVRLRLA